MTMTPDRPLIRQMLATWLWCGILVCNAQLNVPTSISLSGDAPADRRITGLADPSAPDAAVSAAAERNTSMNHTAVSGNGAYLGDISPTPSAYTIGMVVTITPAFTNLAAPTLDLNGLGPRPILTGTGLPLDSATLMPDVPNRLVYDGSGFQLLSSAHRGCPPGFQSPTREYCISEEPLDALTFFSAADQCASLGGRLCTLSEWAYACARSSDFLPTVLAGEWVDHAANNENAAKLAGYGDIGDPPQLGIGCNTGGHRIPSLTAPFRCCTNR